MLEKLPGIPHKFEGGFLDDFKHLHTFADRKDFSVAVIQPSKCVDMSVVEPDNMKQAVLAGWEGAHMALGLKVPRVPHLWEKYFPQVR